MTYAPQIKISFQCPACQKRFTAPSTVAGRQVRCSGCGGSVTVPRPGSAPPVSAAQVQPAAASGSHATSGPISATHTRHMPRPPVTATGTTRSIRTFAIVGIGGLLMLALILTAGVTSANRTTSPPSQVRSNRPQQGFWSSSRKRKTVQLKIGTATITDDEAGTSHVRVACNNGLVIDADWKRNPINEFGYDIYEPSVNQDYNRLAVMVTARGVIAAYLRGEYD